MKKKTVAAMLMAMAVAASVVACGDTNSMAGMGKNGMAAAGLERPKVTQDAAEDTAPEETVADTAADTVETPVAAKPAEGKKAEKKTEKKAEEKKAEGTKTEPAANNNTASKGNTNTQAKTETKPNTVKTPNTVKPSGNTGSSSNGNTGSGNTANTSSTGATKPSSSTVNTGSTGVTTKPSGSTSGNKGGNTENPVVTKPSDNNGGGNSGNTGSSVVAPKPEEPAHVHAWKDHKATKQEWVPNIVTVDDYETRTVTVTYDLCICGATFEIGEEDAFRAHTGAHILAGEPDNTSVEERKETQQVKVGSHEEDHGHYETVEYVDYQYCDCGARQ